MTIIYMTMASALLTLAGTVLHTILKADTSDRREALFLMSLLRAEQQLRDDADAGSLKVESAEILTATMSDQTIVTWSIRSRHPESSGSTGRDEGRDRSIYFPGGQSGTLPAGRDRDCCGPNCGTISLREILSGRDMVVQICRSRSR
jgi:hypothetical protein